MLYRVLGAFIGVGGALFACLFPASIAVAILLLSIFIGAEVASAPIFPCA